MRTADPSAERLRRRFRRLSGELARTGWILLGTIHERRIPAPSPTRRSAATYGPYYQWTFKRAGRTLTVNLSAGQASAFGKAIARQRRIEKLLDAMRELSRQFLEATTEGVHKRKPRT
jgi:hypothetical protein